jgi:hypothetical protein
MPKAEFLLNKGVQILNLDVRVKKIWLRTLRLFGRFRN